MGYDDEPGIWCPALQEASAHVVRIGPDSKPPVDETAVAEGGDQDDQLIILYLVHDAVVTDADAQQSLAANQGLGPVWSGVHAQVRERVQDAPLNGAIQTP